jgi:cell wall assembly regulator SMI1
MSHPRYADLPILALWRSYTDWLRACLPDHHANLAPGASEADLDGVAEVVGHELPLDVRALLSVNDGQLRTGIATASAEDAATPAFPGTCLLSTDLIVEEWRWWRDIDQDQEDDDGESVVPGVVQPYYANRHWIPLLNASVRADYFGLDFDPGPEGRPGQIINFGRDEDCHYVAAPDLTGLLEVLVPTVMAAGPADLRPSWVDDVSHARAADAESLDDYCAFSTFYRLRRPA